MLNNGFSRFILIILSVIFLALPTFSLTNGDFEYSVDNDTQTATITKYLGENPVVNIPEDMDGFSVTTIGQYAFKKKGS